MIKIKFNWTWKDKYKAFVSNRERTMRFIAAQLQTNRAMIFDAEGAYNGRQRWASLRWRKGQILSLTGARGLRGSIAPRNNGVNPTVGANTILNIGSNSVTIGSSLIYASVHDQGATITAKNAQALKIPLPQGGKGPRGTMRRAMKAESTMIDGKAHIFRKSVRIPKRPFTDWTSQDENELTEALTNYMKELWNNG
jgi:phage gpG-like protein